MNNNYNEFQQIGRETKKSKLNETRKKATNNNNIKVSVIDIWFFFL